MTTNAPMKAPARVPKKKPSPKPPRKRCAYCKGLNIIYTDSPIIYYGLVILASATGGFFAVYVGQPLALWLRSIILL